MKELNDGECVHPEECRLITGAWVSDEIKLAVSKGYTIVKIHEIRSYETTQYNGREGGSICRLYKQVLKT